MIQTYPNEQWKVIDIRGASGLQYAVSDFGRMVSFTTTINEGLLLKGSMNKGYKMLKINLKSDGKRKVKSFYLHKLVAELFLTKKNEDQTFVIHLDYQKGYNHHRNLMWANKQQVEAHQDNNPLVIKERKRLQEHNKLHHYKLSEEKVRILKRKLFNPKNKTKPKLIAKTFGISTMQLHRIKTGENWGHVEAE
ncbi:MAG: NUMOD4 domain-containing protein [Bacteroidales bacterium]|nr:NUMOD4 domain-containing protein [Tenuifilaceae bacterium]